MLKQVIVTVDTGLFRKGEVLNVLAELDGVYKVHKESGSVELVVRKDICLDYEPNFLDNYLNGGKKTDIFDFSVLLLMGLAFGYMIVYILIKLGGAL